jgi:lipooligosaccharide transport system permease protein
MKYMKLYDGVIATPVRPFEIALGELAWAMVRGSLYSAAFLAVMVALDLTTVVRALTALPAAVLVGFAFGALGMAVSTLMRSWQDFDLLGSAQFTLFLFSGTFVPAQAYPVLLRWLVEVTPLYRAVHLIRHVTLGTAGWGWLVDVLYLGALLVWCLVVASRRMGGLLYK